MKRSNTATKYIYRTKNNNKNNNNENNKTVL